MGKRSQTELEEVMDQYPLSMTEPLPDEDPAPKLKLFSEGEIDDLVYRATLQAEAAMLTSYLQMVGNRHHPHIETLRSLRDEYHMRRVGVDELRRMFADRIDRAKIKNDGLAGMAAHGVDWKDMPRQ